MFCGGEIQDIQFLFQTDFHKTEISKYMWANEVDCYTFSLHVIDLHISCTVLADG